VEEFYKDEFSKHMEIECLGKLTKQLGVWWQWLKDNDTKEVYVQAAIPKLLKDIKEALWMLLEECPRHG